jgi:choline-sulfatase
MTRCPRALALTFLATAHVAGSAPLLGAQPAPQGGPTNLLFITIDTLRADRLGAYGFPGAVSPAIDGLARDGVLMEDAIASVPLTRPSHATLFTGRQPYEHGIRDNFSKPLDPATPTLATVLKGRGYATGGFIGAYPVSRDSGLQRGFDRYDDPFVAESSRATREDRSERRGSEVVDQALGWLRTPRSAPFFAWVHLFDPHHPYDPPAPFAQRFAKDRYAGEVAYTDSQVQRLLDWIDSAGLRSSTLVVVTADHGEGLGDHGEDEHGFFVYDTTLRVPLVLRWPGRLPGGARVSGQFRSVDLLPTLLDLLGAGTTATSGASRAGLLRAGGRIPDNEGYIESMYASLHFGCAPLRGLRAEGWKYIDAPRAELYRITEDPGETRNRMDDRGSLASAMRTHLEAKDRGEVAAAVPAAGDAAAAERLAALGYVAGGFFSGAPTGTDPKDKIQEFQSFTRDVSRGVRLFEAREYAAAARLLTRLRASTPLPGGKVLERRSFNVEYFLGRSLLELRRFAEAVPPLTRAVAISPYAIPAYVYLSRAQAAAGRGRDALATVERGLTRASANADLHQMKGRVLLRSGDPAGARASLERARDLDPRNPLVRVDLATLHRTEGRLEQALLESAEAVRLAPSLAEAQVAHGLVLGAQGREDLAAGAFRAALKTHPGDPDALFFLGTIEMRSGRSAEARPLFERLVKEAPRYPGAQEALAQASASAAPAPAGAIHLRLLRVGDRARLEDALRRAAAGEDFADLARALSEDASASRGGDLGLVRLADLAEPLKSAAAGLRPGTVSGVFEMAGGFVVVKRER